MSGVNGAYIYGLSDMSSTFQSIGGPQAVATPTEKKTTQQVYEEPEHVEAAHGKTKTDDCAKHYIIVYYSANRVIMDRMHYYYSI